MSIRLVVTGCDADGKSVFVSEEEVAPGTVAIAPGSEFYRLWGGDEIPSLPTDGTPPSQHDYFPPPGGYRFGFFTTPPGQTALPEGLDITAALQEMEEKLPGLAAHMEPGDPGMHTTNTIDYGVVVSGEIWLELDNGEERLLKTGDGYIQNGTRHRWHNRGDVPAVVAIAIVGATRA